VVYLPGLTLGCGLWLIDGVRALKTRSAFTRPRGDARSLLLLWIGIPLVVFALSRSRLPLYILPLFGAIALAIARSITIARGEGATRHAMRLAVVGLVLMIGLKAFASFLPRDEDATRLYREVSRVAGPDAQYALFAEPGWYGFQFYAGQEMKRLSFTGDETWADGRVADALAGRDTNRNLAIVTSSRAAPNLAASLHAAHLSFVQRRAAGREVFVVGASSVSPQTGPLSARK
jgi:4-amino-4-deoxy-L-arabinose transferase